MTSLNTSVASMLKLPPITFGMPKSVITRVKETSAAEIRPYFAPGSVMVKNLRRVEVPSASRRLVEPGVGEGERADQDHQRMREHREALGDDDARRAVDVLEAEGGDHALGDALVAEPVDQRQGREQRRREQRNQGDGAEHALAGNAAARHRVGEAEGQRHRQHRHQRRDPDAVEERLQQGRRLARRKRSWRGRRSAPSASCSDLARIAASGSARNATSASTSASRAACATRSVQWARWRRARAAGSGRTADTIEPDGD